MSLLLINLNADLKRLYDDGYEVSIVANHLVLDNVPYVGRERRVLRGRLVSELSLAGDKTVRPHTHVIMFSGEQPCDHRGEPIAKIINQSQTRDLGGGLVVNHDFSSKPSIGHYNDFYEKLTTYESILSSQAAQLDPAVTARTFRTVENTDETSPFVYIDTASTRAGIGALTRKLMLRRVHIVGLGGTGAYILDGLAKTPVAEIHLHDGDVLGQHNAFRAPGAATLAELRERPFKVDYFRSVYGKMHRNIISHPSYISEPNVDCLRGADFVFLCIDNGTSKACIVEALESMEVPFIDVGMGVQLVDDSLIGVLRVTTSTPQMRSHVHNKQRIPLHGARENDVYAQNIQVADLNMMNAALALMKWKKLCGFYLDLEKEHFSALSIDGNHLLNEDAA